MHHSFHNLEKFIDSHLLPYLLVNKTHRSLFAWKYLLLWTLVWSCLTLALAGPRWNFQEVELFSKEQHLVILLDLSLSMNATDVKPSRLVRAKQKIEDILAASKMVKIGLIAFAADPHMITPITDDKESIRHLLPTLDTSLVYVQGSKLSPALDMAFTMLQGEPGTNKSIIVMSDGGFEDATAIITAKDLGKKGIVIHTMGIGTEEGAPIADPEGKNKIKNGIPVISKLEKTRFQEISNAGNGHYFEAHYSHHDENTIFEDFEKRAIEEIATGKKNRFWEEHFYLFIIPILPIILFWFRRGKILVVLPFLFFISLDATELHFKNEEQRGEAAFIREDYGKAAEEFQDHYRKGVCYYRAGNYAEAESMFKASSRQDVALHAKYNLGNALARQHKLKEAISAYEEVLKQWPEDKKTQDNLAIVKKMLEEQQKQNDQNSEQSDNEKNENDQDNSEGQEGKDNQDNSEGKEDKDSQNGSQPQENKDKDLDKDKDKNEAEEKREDSEQTQLQPKQGETKEGSENQNIQSQEDADADQWLNRMENDPKTFMKNKFYIETKKNGTKEGCDPW